ncbi:hypothetical protein [Thalassovita sp.]|uniref:hypothetical protein n=1 Tax=Thalassovita sp. TaxID=1979401 RepID=UPI002B26F86B|nr:hypothetical protein [Thalassovita sp.]
MRSTFSLASDLEKLAETYRGKDRHIATSLYQSACRLRDQMREAVRLQDEIDKLKVSLDLSEKRADMLECEVDHFGAVRPTASAPTSPAPPKPKR